MQSLLPQYQIISLLGHGGMGAVYKGRQKSLDRLVAIKILPPGLEDGDANFTERFKNEARTMARLNHPGIVSVYDFGETTEGQFYFVMEFVDGTDVAKMIVASGRLPADHALSITAHVCDALAYAHSNGVIHRDIKPANILINMQGQVKVADFGLAKVDDPSKSSGLTRTGLAMGTPDFVAPEALVMGMEVDGRADLYAIGVMLYNMLTGEIPRGMWTMPGAKLGTDPRFDAIIAKAMQTDREARYQSAAELRRDLDNILTLPHAALVQQQKEAAEAAKRARRKAEAAAAAPAKGVSPSPAKSAPPPPPEPKSKTGLLFALGASVALAVGAYLVVGGKGRSKPEKPTPAAVAESTKVSPPKPVPPASKPAAPKTSTPPPKAAVAAAAPPAFAESVPVLGTKAQDLLPGLDLGLDIVGGKWKRNGDVLTYESRSGDMNARMQFPVRASGSYTLDVELSPNPTPGDVALFLPFPKPSDDEFHNIAFTVNHGNKGAHKAGFVHFHTQPAFSRDTPGWVSLEKPLEGRSRITVQVLERQPDRLALKAWLNGRPLVAWEGPRSETTGGSRVWRPASKGWFAVGTTEAGTTFHRVRIEAVDGEITWIREPAKLATAPTPGPAIPRPSGMTPAAPDTPTADPVSAKLASLEKTFLDAYEKQVGAAHKAAVADLNAKFAAALDRSIATVSQAGKLEEALTLRNEKTLIQSTGAVPETDEEATPATLKALRKTWRTSMAALVVNRNKLAAPLHAAYDRALAAYQDELTKTQQLDAATRVKAVRAHIVAQRESSAPPTPTGSAATTRPAAPLGNSGKVPVPVAPIMPPLPADKVLSPPVPATQEEIRALCEWVLQKDGSVRLRSDGQDVTFEKSDALPKGRLIAVHVSVYDLSFDPKDDEQKWFALMGRMPDVESIYFNKNSGTMPVELLRGATKLKSLRLTPTSVDDAALAHLAGLRNLESLEITYMVKQFTGTGLGYLNPNLLSFGTSSPTLTAAGLAQLPRFKKLKKLAITGDSLGGRTSTLTDADFAVLAALTELEELDLSERAGLDGSFLAHLPANSKLKRLDLYGIKTFKPENLKHLTKLKHLEFLSLPPVDPGAEALSILAGLDQLSELALIENHAFSGEGFKGLKGFRNLQRLNLHTCPVTDAAMDAVSTTLPELKSLEMTNAADFKVTLTAEGFTRALSRFKSMTNLQLHGERTTDAWVPAIAQLKALDYVMLTGAQITDQGLVPLMKLPLGYLRLDGTQVTDAVIPILKTCPTLNSVPVGGTKMTDAGKAELKKMLEANAK